MGFARSRVWRRSWLLVACLLLLGTALTVALTAATPATARHGAPLHFRRVAGAPLRGWWIATWSASPQAPVPGSAGASGFSGQTVRNTVFSSLGGTRVRVRFTNVFGATSLRIGRAAIGLAGDGASVADGKRVALTFGGRPSVVVPAGREVVSDPAALPVPALRELSVSLYLPSATGPATEHAAASQTGYLAAGDHALDTGDSAFRARGSSWYFIDGVDVLTHVAGAGAIVALGDSITDGVGSGLGRNARWPNDLARRLDQSGRGAIGVVDAGIGGNRVLSDPPCCGVSAVARFPRDVVARAGAREVILLEGINDIGQVRGSGALSAPHTVVSAAQIIAGDEQIVRQAHAAGLRIIGATMTPFAGSRHFSANGELTRERVNRWIRSGGAFDGVIDFARVLADPAAPQRLDPAHDSGDHIHPNDAGYQAMASAINLTMLLAG